MKNLFKILFLISITFSQNVITNVIKNDDGQIQEIEYYKKNGKELKLDKKEFYHLGVLSSEEKYDHKKGISSFVSYDLNNGNISITGQFKGDSQIGLWVWYHDNKRISHKGYWDACKTNSELFFKIGKWDYFDEKGKLIKRYIYSNCNGQNCPCPSPENYKGDINYHHGNLIEIIEY